MSTRVDTLSLIPGSTVCGHRGLGVLGSTILLTTSDGDNGPGILYNDVESGDEGREFRAFVPSPPPGIFIYEDGSFVYDGPSRTFNYELFVDGVSHGIASVTAATAADSGTVELAANWIAPFSLSAVLNVRDPSTLPSFSSSLRVITISSDIAGPLKSFAKHPRERLDYRFDFGPWLADCGDAIAQEIVESNSLGVDEVIRESNAVVVLISGGVKGKSYRLPCLISTLGGRTKEAEIIINVM